MTDQSAMPGGRTGDQRQVAIVGGGLAGLAAAVRLTQAGVPADVYESRQCLGGRAGSFLDPATDTWVDHCQHVGMGCCSQLIDLCSTIGQSEFFRRDTNLYFVGPTGETTRFSGTPWLPAPLHLTSAFLRLPYLNLRQKWRIAQNLRRLVSLPNSAETDELSAESWLSRHGEEARSLDLFWSVVAVSALSESLDHVSLAALRKVFRDGFLSSRTAYHVLIPQRPLGELSDAIAHWLQQRGSRVFRGAMVERVAGDSQGVTGLRLRELNRPEDVLNYRQVILAVPWHRLRDLFDPSLAEELPALCQLDSFQSASIASVHLWWDRLLVDLPHAVLLERLSQWLFYHGEERSSLGEKTHHYQVVVSASHRVAKSDKEKILQTVIDELRAVWPRAAEGRVVHQRLLVQPHAVFSPLPGLERIRPDQRTPVPGLYWAGDWTRTGWPATMEGAIRSGELAAAALLQDSSELSSSRNRVNE